VVFVLDTTGSMGELIQAAKEKIWSIATTLASAEQQPMVRVGLVAYRDRGDGYVTRVVDLSDDLDSVYAQLMDFQAAGGGDGPESVNQALHDALHKVSWSRDQGTYRAVFLVGDAPPHMDYQDDIKYPETIRLAAQRGIVVNTVQCGTNRGATPHWQRIARLGLGAYAQVEQSGNAVAITTPFDQEIARLSRALDDTRLFYGDAKTKDRLRAKEAATAKLHSEASAASRARRATFNLLAGGKKNLLGDSDLVEDVESGRVKLDEVKREHLPAAMQEMDGAARGARIAQLKQQRGELQRQIATLAEKRGDYLRKRVQEEGGAAESLDQKLFDAVRDQAAAKGMSYGVAAPSY